MTDQSNLPWRNREVVRRRQIEPSRFTGAVTGKGHRGIEPSDLDPNAAAYLTVHVTSGGAATSR